MRIITSPGDVTMVSTDDIIEIAKSSFEITTVFPFAASSATPGKRYWIVDGYNIGDPGAASNYNITISGVGVITQDSDSRCIYSNGTNWRFI